MNLPEYVINFIADLSFLGKRDVIFAKTDYKSRHKSGCLLTPVQYIPTMRPHAIHNWSIREHYCGILY